MYKICRVAYIYKGIAGCSSNANQGAAKYGRKVLLTFLLCCRRRCYNFYSWQQTWTLLDVFGNIFERNNNLICAKKIAIETLFWQDHRKMERNGKRKSWDAIRQHLCWLSKICENGLQRYWMCLSLIQIRITKLVIFSKGFLCSFVFDNSKKSGWGKG